MRQKVSALWMAFFACLACPFWLAEPWVILLPLVAGGATGWWLQSALVGPRASLVGATIGGIICAFLSLPIIGLGFVAAALGPERILSEPGKLFGGLGFFVFLGAWLLWWWIAAWGALAGFTLQLALWLVDRSKDRCPLCRMASAA